MHLQASRIAKLTLLALTACTFACTSETYGTGDGAFVVQATCTLRHQCGERFDFCIEDGRSACNACNAVGGIYCRQFCDYRSRCSNQYCSADDPCWSSIWSAERGEEDPGIRRACEAASERYVSCGRPTWPEGSCEVFAQTERPEAERIYRCSARAACGEEATCGAPAPDAETAQIACAGIAECGSWEACNDPNALAAWMGWLRDDAKDALVGCMALSDCTLRIVCVNAWSDAFDVE